MVRYTLLEEYKQGGILLAGLQNLLTREAAVIVSICQSQQVLHALVNGGLHLGGRAVHPLRLEHVEQGVCHLLRRHLAIPVLIVHIEREINELLWAQWLQCRRSDALEDEELFERDSAVVVLVHGAEQVVHIGVIRGIGQRQGCEPLETG